MGEMGLIIDAAKWPNVREKVSKGKQLSGGACRC